VLFRSTQFDRPGALLRNHAEVVRLVGRTEFKLEWQPEISRIVRNKGAADHAHNLIRLSVELNVFADDAAISAKSPLPQTVTQHNHISAVGAVFRRRESPTRDHGCAKNRKIVSGYVYALYLFRLIVTGQVQ